MSCTFFNPVTFASFTSFAAVSPVAPVWATKDLPSKSEVDAISESLGTTAT